MPPGPNPATSKLKVDDLAELRRRIDPAADAAALIADAGDAAAMLDRLADRGFLAEAARLVAHALPRREAVWWACMCARHTAPPDLPKAESDALEAAEHWVRRPTDEARRAGFAAAQLAGFGGAEAWTAVAAFWSGGSMAPLGQPDVLPAAHLAGTAVAGSVALAAVRHHPARRPVRLARFVQSARHIAAGGDGRLPPEVDQHRIRQES